MFSKIFSKITKFFLEPESIIIVLCILIYYLWIPSQIKLRFGHENAKMLPIVTTLSLFFFLCSVIIFQKGNNS